MSSPANSGSHAVSPETLITIKITVNDHLKKLKLPLRDLGATVLPDKLRTLLAIKPEQTVTFERFSDSAGSYITLDINNPQVFKTLVRAAKAKLKLRLRATVTPLPQQEQSETTEVSSENTAAVDPLIVHSPSTNSKTPQRGSTAVDRKSMGSGIFQFKDARASQQALAGQSEAPTPKPFTYSPESKAQDAQQSSSALPLRFREKMPQVANSTYGHTWSVYCNECDVAMSDAHYHCSICDGGDYDLCERCVAAGKLCPGDKHWLIKRSIRGENVITSTTERIQPRSTKPTAPAEMPAEKEKMPGTFTEEAKPVEESTTPTRTCNSCVVVLPEDAFVTCTSCDDYDLCLKCHSGNRHGHHPAHGFEAATNETALNTTAKAMLAPGRHVRHNAICDRCDDKIYGVRHKCLVCPDFDYCSNCVKDAVKLHPKHRFAPLYEPIGDARVTMERHVGIYCDGPLCANLANPTYIVGVRYKCAVCHDTDFCDSCESHPSNKHNATHPVLKFKKSVAGVTVSTMDQPRAGVPPVTLGDGSHLPQPADTTSSATQTRPVNAATPVQTMAEFKPSEDTKAAQSIPVVKSEPASPFRLSGKVGPSSLLNAHFVQDSVQDGTVLAPEARFTQMWTLRNPGPYIWPAGCSVRFVGGDSMLNVDNTRPAATSDIANATESNVIGRDVEVGEEAAFKITLKAPTREGKCISYWRMKAADGTPFGHRLWCDIEVKKPVPIPAPFTCRQPELSAVLSQAQRSQAQEFQASQQSQHQAFLMRRHEALRQQQQQQQQYTQYQQAMQNMQPMPGQPPRMAAMDAPQAYQAPPPAYDYSLPAANSTARLAAKREQQARSRQQTLDFHAMANHSNGVRDPAPSSECAGPTNQQSEHPAWAQYNAQQQQRSALIRARATRLRQEKENSYRQALEFEKKYERDNEKVQKMINQVTQAPATAPATEQPQPQAAAEEPLERSQMVFPRLDKESPANSTYQSAASSATFGKAKAAYVEDDAGEVERDAAVPAAAAAAPVAAAAAAATAPVAPSSVTSEDFDDLTVDDDIEVLSADGDVSEDDGFLTDEEYDILDASDHETVASQ